MNKLIALLLAAFSAFSTVIVVQHGYWGFLSLAARDPWALQMLLDLVISNLLIAAWIRNDARERGLVWLPYLVVMLFLGSIGSLAYLVHRALRAPRTVIASFPS